MNRSPRFAFLLVAIAAAVANPPAFAAWPHASHDGNVSVCGAMDVQYDAKTVTDGAGGAIVAWNDYRSHTSLDIYAQRVSAEGVPLWTTDGVAVCSTTGADYNQVLVPDGAGGAFIAWQDSRGGAGFDIYAQHINGTGQPVWTVNGVAVCAAPGDQQFPTIVEDGSGGVIVSWDDDRGGDLDIYSQRVDSAGNVRWPVNGVGVCVLPGSAQLYAVSVPDRAGGAILAWHDDRSGLRDIYAQRVDASGVPRWTEYGRPVCASDNEQIRPSIISDGEGGAIIAWYDVRTNRDYDIYAQRLHSTGGAYWAMDGVPVCASWGNQLYPKLASDGENGAIVAWYDRRDGNYDVYAQRINFAGAPQWTEGGEPVSTAERDQGDPEIAADGFGGAVIAWNDARDGESPHVYAQRLDAFGRRLWTANGVAVSTTASTLRPTVAADGSGGAIVGWTEARRADYDVYAQRIDPSGYLGNPEPVITEVHDVPNDQGGAVEVSWQASYLEAGPTPVVSEYRVFRSVWAGDARRIPTDRGASENAGRARGDGALLAGAGEAGANVWELVGTLPAEGLPGYSRVVGTSRDSMENSNPPTRFKVEARQGPDASASAWSSAPVSGYSVDNLPPSPPGHFTGMYHAGVAALRWDSNLEPDLGRYQLFRGPSAGFTPGAENLILELQGLAFMDPVGSPQAYKLIAVDIHGNSSPAATLVPDGAVGAPFPTPGPLSLSAPKPNPARDRTELHFTLSREGPVALALFDAAGRRVRRVHDGVRAAGEYTVSLSLEDESGGVLASGLYVLRLEAEGRVLTRRLAAIR